MATTMAAADSDSDDQERPQEPEFVIHVVDDHRPPAPPGQMHMPAPPPNLLFPPERPPHSSDDRRTECTYRVFLEVTMLTEN
jgi:hypothetical protein